MCMCISARTIRNWKVWLDFNFESIAFSLSPSLCLALDLPFHLFYLFFFFLSLSGWVEIDSSPPLLCSCAFRSCLFLSFIPFALSAFVVPSLLMAGWLAKPNCCSLCRSYALSFFVTPVRRISGFASRCALCASSLSLCCCSFCLSKKVPDRRLRGLNIQTRGLYRVRGTRVHFIERSKERI